MITAMLLGMGAGTGLLAVVRGLLGRRVRLTEVIALLDGTARPAPAVPWEGGWASRAGRPLVPVLVGLGVPSARAGRDLEIVGYTAQRLLAEKAAAAVAGALLTPAAVLLLMAGGLHMPLEAPAWLTAAAGVGGFLIPDLVVRGQAVQRRSEFRHALGVYLDLVVVSLAAGVGVDAALTYAAGIGDGWAITRIRAALQTAHLERRPPWRNLGELGDRLAVPELVELAATLTLAGTEGAKVRGSLAAKAAALRAHELADTEARAQAATERLSLPVVLLFAGFLILLGYPAIAQVFTDF